MKKLKIILIWFSIIAYMVIIWSFVADKRKNIICSGADVFISDFDVNRFVTSKNIINLFEKYKFKYIGEPIDSINVLVAENLVYHYPSIKKADAYVSDDGRLNIKISQRVPLVRVVNNFGQSYYIDVDGKIMPFSDQFTAYTIIASGHINEPRYLSNLKTIFVTDTLGRVIPNILIDIFEMAKYIKNNRFWSSQIEQIYINEKKDMELVPRVGSQIIIFGSAEDMEIKFDKIKSIYKIFNRVGWNKYKLINVKFKNQIICTRR